MVRILLKISIYLALFLSFTSYAHGQSNSSVNYVPGEVIVKLKNSSQSQVTGQSFMSKAQNEKGMQLKDSFARIGLYHYALKPGQSVEDSIRDLKADPEVEYAEPNYIFSKETVGGVNQSFSIQEVSSMSNASGYLATGAPIQVPNTWNIVTPHGTPIVAVIDTGLDTTHPVFSDSNAVWTNPGEIPNNGIDDDHNGYVDDVHGWNFVNNSKTMIDDDGHGTHVSGIILGVTENIYVQPYQQSIIKIMPLKFLDGSGYGKTSDAVRAIYYAVNNGASVLNNSWGGPSYSAALHEAIAYAYSAGAVFVAAAGNNGSNNDSSPMYPASYDVPNLISVAATTDTDVLAYFSNYGKNSVDVASPGVFILSTIPGGFGSMSGTSMATPFVSGLAALMKAEQPGLLGAQAKDLILSNSDIITDGSGNPTLNSKISSAGRMDVYQTIEATKVATISSTQPAYTFTNADRGVASTAGGGCGLVTKMLERGGPGAGGGLETWSVIVVLGLFALPLLLYNALRSRRPEQRRKFDRYKINSEVKVSLGDRELVASVSSISLGGVQLDTDALLDQGGIVSMVIRSPDGKDQISVEGRVVWSETQNSYGVQFAETTQTVRERISSWTKSLVKA